MLISRSNTRIAQMTDGGAHNDPHCPMAARHARAAMNARAADACVFRPCRGKGLSCAFEL